MPGEPHEEGGGVEVPAEPSGFLRLFVALELPRRIQERLGHLSRRLRGELPQARWVASEKVHLTLVFLGKTAAPDLPGLCASLAPVFAASAPMQLRFCGAGTFPGRRSGRVAWLGLDGGAKLSQLQQEVERKACRAVGRSPEKRRFRPHLTLARCRPPWPAPAVERFVAAAELEDEFAVDCGTLFESRLGPRGSTYQVRGTFPLGGGA